MSIVDRLKNAGFWISLISFIPIVLESFGVSILPETWGAIKEFLLALVSLLVVLGILNNPTTESKFFLDDKSGGDKE